jgi:hypothetical protein
MLMTMAEEYKRQGELFPSPERLEKVYSSAAFAEMLIFTFSGLSADRNTLNAYSIGLLLHQCPSVYPLVTRVNCAKTKQLTKIIITLPGSLFLKLSRGIRSFVSDTVFDAEVQGKTPTPWKTRFAKTF